MDVSYSQCACSTEPVFQTCIRIITNAVGIILTNDSGLVAES